MVRLAYHIVPVKYCTSVLIIRFSYSLSVNFNKDTEQEIPPVEFILSYGPLWSMGKKEDEIKEYRKWNSTLGNFGWSHADDFDIELLETIKRGYVVEELFIPLVEQEHKKRISGDFEEQYNKVWREVYHNGFGNEEEVLVKEFVRVFNDGAEYFNSAQLNECIVVLRRLGRNTEAS